VCCLQELLEIKHSSWKFTIASMTLRTGLLGLVVLTAIAVPFFASVMSFIGSFMATSVAVVLPCIFALKICRHQLSKLDVGVAIAMAVFGTVVGVVGTYNAIMGIASKYD
jgi:vesicular inhibitory amino acid transporter